MAYEHDGKEDVVLTEHEHGHEGHAHEGGHEHGHEGHAHEGGHEHGQEGHVREGGHEHGHEWHVHEGGHEHVHEGHTHEHGVPGHVREGAAREHVRAEAGQAGAKPGGPASGYLRYLSEHNRAHAEELLAMARKLDSSGDAVGAGLVRQAAGLFAEGSALIEKALEKASN
jgi:hypothetical protein